MAIGKYKRGGGNTIYILLRDAYMISILKLLINYANNVIWSLTLWNHWLWMFLLASSNLKSLPSKLFYTVFENFSIFGWKLAIYIYLQKQKWYKTMPHESFSISRFSLQSLACNWINSMRQTVNQVRTKQEHTNLLYVFKELDWLYS